MHDPNRTIDFWPTDPRIVQLWSNLYELIWSGTDREFAREFLDPSAWMTVPAHTHSYSPGGWIPPRSESPWAITVGASVPSRRVPNPSYVVGGLGWVSPAAGLRMEARLGEV